MRAQAPARHTVRAVELLSKLSVALDAAAGAPPQHAQRTAVLSLRVAEAMGIGDRDRSSLLYAALLHEAGSPPAASSTGRAAIQRLVVLGRGSDEERRAQAHARARHGAQLALRAGFGPEVAVTVMALREHWDGRGLPIGLARSAIPLFARVVAPAHDLDRLIHDRGAGHAQEAIHSRAGTWYDPEIVGVLLALCANGLLSELEPDELARHVGELEPSWLIRRIDRDETRRMRAAVGRSRPGRPVAGTPTPRPAPISR